MRTLLALHCRRRRRHRLPHRLPPLRRRPRRHQLPTLRRPDRRNGIPSLMPAKYESPPTEFDPNPRRAPGARSYMVPLLAIAAAVAIVDRITKHFIMHRLPEGSAHTVIPGVLRITHVLNTGAAFSMFSDSARTVAVRHGLVLFSIV